MRVILIFMLLFVSIFVGILMLTGSMQSRVLPFIRQNLALDESVTPVPESGATGDQGSATATATATATTTPPPAPAPEAESRPTTGASDQESVAESGSLAQVMERTTAQERDLSAQVRRLAALEATVSALLTSREEEEGAESWQALVRVFSSMRAEESARIVGYLPDEEAIRLLTTMKPRDAGQVMALLDPQRAALLSRLLATGAESASLPEVPPDLASGVLQ